MSLATVACASDAAVDSDPPTAAPSGDRPDGQEPEPDPPGQEDGDDGGGSASGGNDPAEGPPPAPETPARFELSEHEVLPEAKDLASEVVQMLTTYEPDDTSTEVAQRVLTASDGSDAQLDRLAATAAPLHHEGAWSRGEVVYPQLGGATDTDVSVMVVVRQLVGLPDGTAFEETRTLDVRLTFVDGGWVFASLEDAGGDPVPRPRDLAPEAEAVLDDDRIELPDSAIWDIHAGRADPQLLRVMSDLADRHSYGVVVLETGHPVHIFDTDRVSTHLYGIAVDVYRLDEELVIDGREEGSLVHQTVEWLHAHPEVTNLGSPWALDGFGGRSFTDLVHQDHLHIEAGERPAGPPPHRPELADEIEDVDGDAP